MDEEGQLVLQPLKVLDYRQTKRGRHRRKLWQVLIHWQQLSFEEATWEDYDEISNTFSKFILEDKDVFQGRANVTAPTLTPGASVSFTSTDA